MATIFYPGAEPRQLAGKSTTPLSPRVINVHTMVWFLTACEAYFALSGKPYSHFGTEGDGRTVQWQDLQYRAASDLNGNPFCISIENADKGTHFPTWSGSDVPRFTAPQAAALVELIAWLCVRFAIPPVLLNDSLPGRVGPSYHRLGIDPWRVDGGVLYSSAYAKACPGDRRIAQLRDEIMPAVRTLLEPPPPTASQEDDMPTLYTSYDPNQPYLLSDGSGLSVLGDARSVINAAAVGAKEIRLDPGDYTRKVDAASIADEVAAVTLYASSINTQIAELRALSAEQLEALRAIAVT